MATWQPLGLINPAINQFVSAPISSVGGEVFRISFRNLGPNPPVLFRSYGWIDAQYSTGERSLARKIYPSVEPQIIQIPIPADLRLAGIPTRNIRVQKKLYYRIGRTGDPNWTVFVEQFVGDPANPADFTINLF